MENGGWGMLVVGWLLETCSMREAEREVLAWPRPVCREAGGGRGEEGDSWA